MPAAEHILLESDSREVPAARDARKVHARIRFRSRLRRRVVHLEIIDYYYLAVRSGSRAGPLDYVLDLRFVDGPRLSRRIAWRWIAGSLLLMGLALAIAVRIGSSPTPWWRHDWLAAFASIAGLWALVTLVAAYRTSETVSLTTTHGAARVLGCTGGLGTFHALKRFIAKLAAHVQLASAARRSRRAEHLRDEMREHLRLREIGVLSADEYETAKLHVLRQHAPAARSSRAGAATRS